MSNTRIISRRRRGLTGIQGAQGNPGDTNPPAPTTDVLSAARYLSALKVTTGDALATSSVDIRYHIELPDFASTKTGNFLIEIFGSTLETTTAHGFVIDLVYGGYCFAGNSVITRAKYYDRTGDARPVGAYFHSTTNNLVLWFDAGNFFTTFDVRGKRVGNGTTAGQSINGILHFTETGVTL